MREGALVLSLRALKPGGKFVVIGWREKNDENVKVLRECVAAAAAAATLSPTETERGSVHVDEPFTVECDVAFDGVMTHMEWTVLVVTKI